MAEKKIQISDDSGTTWYTFTGNSGDLSEEAEQIDDSIYGTSYGSNTVGLLTWSLSSNALYKGFAGYEATIKKSGTSTPITGGGMTQVGSTSTWETTLATTNIWDRAVTVTVYDTAVDVTADVESIDYIWGRITFTSGSEPVGAVTADFSHLPTADYGKAREFTLTQNADTIDTSDFETVQANSGYRTYEPSTRTVSLSMSGFYALSNGFKALLEAREEMVIEINPSGSSTESACRGYFKVGTSSQSGDFGGNEDESVDMVLSSPDVDIVPFSWIHPSTTTMPDAVKLAIEAWQDELKYDYRYLADGLIGSSGTGCLTDVSLSAGLSSMSEVSISVQGDGELTPVA